MWVTLLYIAVLVFLAFAAWLVREEMRAQDRRRRAREQRGEPDGQTHPLWRKEAGIPDDVRPSDESAYLQEHGQ